MAHLPDRSPAPFHWQFLSTRAAGQDPYSSERLHRHWTAPTTAPKESSIATQMGPEHWHNEEVPLIPHDKLKDDRDTEEVRVFRNLRRLLSDSGQ